MTRANNPLECGLDRYCALDAPIEFIGREALRRIHAQGVERRIRGLRIQGAPLPPCQERWPVRASGQEIGRVTSAANSPDLACGIALAMLDRGHWQAGEPVEVEAPDGPRSARVAELPFTLDDH
jgi:dimethylsulfoniopropionate demethylase